MGKGGKSHEETKSGEDENMAAWLVGLNTLKIQPFKLPPLGPHDARVRMKAVGICGSDVHYLKTMRCADFVVKEPMVIGHECAGIIEEVGSEVKNLVPGDRVALEPGISCWRCDLCKDGRYNLCPEMKFLPLHQFMVLLPIRLTFKLHFSIGSSLLFGAYFATKIAYSKGFQDTIVIVVHPADLCFKLPDNVSLEEGAMCEPLSVGVHACRRANIGPETNVLVMGAGPIGLVTMMAARAFGAPRIVIVDVDDNRLSVAKNLGADGIVKVSTDMQDVAEEVERICKAMGGGVDVCLVGMGHHEMTVPLLQLLQGTYFDDAVKILFYGALAICFEHQSWVDDVIGIFRYRNTWPLCIEFLRSGKIDVKPLITQKEVEEAFETSAGGGSAIKVMFNL
ncbi:hypothetical protein CXB51_021872 [Gossypium anomalum]|uniref:Enoyl reductase (ER) domain-containing protein n=1 Tax=Gossypium anomalum TaxID=47600 RepID=A0A8J5YQH8_9ROSI|nr:hypothetical protein CXB51_021872 [Gossypium anomalum]